MNNIGINDINKRIAALSPEQRALLELRLQQKELRLKKLTSISKRKDSDILYLSLIQERLWFLYQLQPDIPLYNESSLFRITGDLNSKLLEQSINQIIQRHEILRTTFKTVEGQPLQIIAPKLTITLPVVDLQAWSEIKQEELIKQLVTEQSSQPFHLTQGPLLRGTLVQIKPQEHIILLTMHHIISDGWSWQVFYRELGTLYQTITNSSESALPELPIQYADFAIWQRQTWDQQKCQSGLAYWKQKLENLPPVLALPTDNPRPAVQSFRGAREPIILPQSLTEALKSLSQMEGVTLFMLLLTAFKILLYRYTGQTDLIVATPVANRSQIETENLLGCFVNTLILQTDLSDNPSFRELLKQVQEITLAAYSYQDFPFELLVKELQPERTLSHTPLFQVMFVCQDAPLQSLELPGLKFTPLIVDSGTAKLDLTLFLEDTKQGLMGALEYNTDLFETDTISRMIGHFQTLLTGIVAHPDANISKLPLLTNFEQNQLLVDWNDTKVDYPQDQCLHQLFEDQVERTPNAIALIYENQQLTYSELNAKANQLAHYLQKQGVEPQTLVGICVERSPQMVIGLLAILKAGSTYIPIDPNYPQERLAWMLEDSQTSILLSQQHLVESLPSHKTQVICLDSHWEKIAGESLENPLCNLNSNHLAYVIYTSGSTGKPKGAMNTHLGICNRLLWMQDTYQLTAADSVLQKTPFSFDVSVWEFFWPLITGARLVVARPDGHRDPNYLINLITQQQITTLHFVPSMLQAFLEAEGLENCQCLKRVICSGEALSVELQKRFFARLEVDLHNLYGPTEAAIDVTYYKCSPKNSNQQTVPIGRPIANTQIYLLDQYLNPVPVGVTGELYIGGVGVGKGYLHNEQLTTEKFIPNLFEQQIGSHLYKTGDLARYLPDATLEFLGRIDHQVKLRGFRIELGEIEAVLSQHSAVREAVVLPHTEKAGNKSLVAYILPISNHQYSNLMNNLRSFVKQKLPEYMLPNTFILLETMPLTPNGKVNRQALPTPEQQNHKNELSFTVPETSVEKQLAAIWTQVLGVEKISVNDNFFALGGDSILILQVISQANQTGLHLTVKQMFQYQTIAQLATVASTSKQIIAEQGIVKGLVLLTPIQHWFFAQKLPNPHHWNQSLLLKVQQPLDLAILKEVVRSLLLHHDLLRSRLIEDEMAISLPDDHIPLIYLDLSNLSEQEQEAAIIAKANEIQTSLNLSTSLLQFANFELGAKRTCYLLLVIHHLIVDGVSWRILVEDLQTAYQQLRRGQTIQLPAKTTSYQQWSKRLQEYAQSPIFDSELDYWQKVLSQPVTPLPLDYPGKENTEATAQTISVSLDREETQALLQDIPVAYRTQINDVLLAALAQTFAQWTKKSSLLIDLEAHGREELFEDIDLSRTVGWFTSIFPVLLDLGKANHPGEILLTIKEQLRNIPQRGIGYGILRYLSNSQEITEQLRSPFQPEVIFNYLGQFDQVLPQSSLFKLTQNYKGVERSPQSDRPHKLEINGGISQGRLQMNWTYSQNLHRCTTIEGLAQEFIKILRAIIAHCQSPDAGGFSLSDFPLVQVNQDQLHQALGKISFSGG
ncbi:MAG: amino acid adenylation domain-containing protein [Nostoc sp.]|uniref:amino acid adenylation domain-containing protein n=1 Tax=Nostoc sp. TaxID=1180 RepID=UPI002FEE667E